MCIFSASFQSFSMISCEIASMFYSETFFLFSFFERNGLILFHKEYKWAITSSSWGWGRNSFLFVIGRTVWIELNPSIMVNCKRNSPEPNSKLNIELSDNLDKLNRIVLKAHWTELNYFLNFSELLQIKIIVFEKIIVLFSILIMIWLNIIEYKDKKKHLYTSHISFFI